MNYPYEKQSEDLDIMDNNFVLWYSLRKYVNEMEEKHKMIENVNDLPKTEALAYLHERQMLINAHEILEVLDYELWK